MRILGTDLEDYLSTIPECFEQIPEFRHVYLLIACMIRQRGLHLQLTPLLVFGLIAVFYYERRKQRSRTLTENVLKFIEYFGVGSFHERKISYQTHNRYEIFQ